MYFTKNGVFFGVGIGTSRGISQGVPFDVMGMILEAEGIKRRNNSEVTVLVADEHAKVNGFSLVQIEEVSGETKALIENITNSMGFADWNFVLGSEIMRDGQYREIFSNLSDIDNSYIRKQLTDVQWFNQERGVGVKLGWRSLECARDEGFFDRKFQEFFPDSNMEFVYTEAGKLLSGQEAAPYFCTNTFDRLVLTPNEDISSKVKRASKRVTRKYWSNIVSVYERMVDTDLGNVNLKQKLTKIYDNLFRGLGGEKYV